MGSDIRRRVIDGMREFERQLPELLVLYRERWVVFLDGTVRGVHDTEEAAFAQAMSDHGPESGVLVVQVTERNPQPLSAALYFRT